MTIKIGDREIKLKYSFRALLLYENILKKSFAPETTTDVLVFMFCVIMGSAKDLQLDFNEFLDMIDENPHLMTEFAEWLTGEINKTNTLTPEDDEEKKKLKQTK